MKIYEVGFRHYDGDTVFGKKVNKIVTAKSGEQAIKAVKKMMEGHYYRTTSFHYRVLVDMTKG